MVMLKGKGKGTFKHWGKCGGDKMEASFAFIQWWFCYYLHKQYIRDRSFLKSRKSSKNFCQFLFLMFPSKKK